ncbi:MAG: hypothetical protein ACNS62_03950 [Candidatus Cyclobacteriaceae bacterium M3_2C_046]
MKVLFRIALIFLLFISAISARAQETGDYEYSSEFIWGVTKATNSGLIGGLIFKMGKEIGPNRFQSFGLELVNIKHPQEERHYSYTGNTFIWAKKNYLYSIRLQYGREWILFKKAPQQGVQINGILAGGPSIGLEAPYYIEYESGAGGSSKVPYDPTAGVHDYNQILGTGNIFQGIEESQIVPGLNLKAALSFEFGTFKSNVVGLEAGAMLEAFSRKIIIIPNTDNYSVFPNAFITLFYGSRR